MSRLTTITILMLDPVYAAGRHRDRAERGSFPSKDGKTTLIG
jgi:hypothetical protein